MSAEPWDEALEGDDGRGWRAQWDNAGAWVLLAVFTAYPLATAAVLAMGLDESAWPGSALWIVIAAVAFAGVWAALGALRAGVRRRAGRARGAGTRARAALLWRVIALFEERDRVRWSRLVWWLISAVVAFLAADRVLRAVGVQRETPLGWLVWIPVADMILLALWLAAFGLVALVRRC